MTTFGPNSIAAFDLEIAFPSDSFSSAVFFSRPRISMDSNNQYHRGRSHPYKRQQSSSYHQSQSVCEKMVALVAHVSLLTSSITVTAPYELSVVPAYDSSTQPQAYYQESITPPQMAVYPNVDNNIGHYSISAPPSRPRAPVPSSNPYNVASHSQAAPLYSHQPSQHRHHGGSSASIHTATSPSSPYTSRPLTAPPSPTTSSGRGTRASPSQEKFVCETCGLAFSRAYDRKRHQQSKHASNPPEHACNRCHQVYTRYVV
jgi:hypothetical protein